LKLIICFVFLGGKGGKVAVVDSRDAIQLIIGHPKMKYLQREASNAYVERETGAMSGVERALQAATDPSEGQKMLQRGFRGAIMYGGFREHVTKSTNADGSVVFERVLERSVMCGDDGPEVNFNVAEKTVQIGMSSIDYVLSNLKKDIQDKTNATSKIVNATNDALPAGDTTCVEEDSSSEDLAHKLDTKIPALEICRDAKALTVTVPKETVLPVEVSTDKQSTLLQQIRENTNTMLPETHKDIEDTSSKILAQKFCSQPHDDNSIQTKEPNLSEIMQAMQMQIEEKQRQLDAKDKVIEMHVSGMAVKRAAGNEGETTVSKKARVSCSRTDKPEVVPKNIIWNNGIFAWRKRIRKVSAYKGGYKSIAEAQEGLALFCSEMNVGT